MVWFAVKVLESFRLASNPDQFPTNFWENVLLVEAAEERQAFIAAKKLSDTSNERNEFQWTVNGGPCKKQYEAIRGCIHPLVQQLPTKGDTETISDGTVVSESLFRVQDQELKLLLDEDESAIVLYLFDGRYHVSRHFSKPNNSLPRSTSPKVEQWFTAHLVSVLHPVGGQDAGEDNKTLVLEEAVLVSDFATKNILDKIDALGKTRESCKLDVNKCEFRIEYLGCRKINDPFSPLIPNTRNCHPQHGTELTYTQFEANSHSESAALINCEDSNVLYLTDQQSE